MKILLDVVAILKTKLLANSVSNVHISNYKLLRTDSTTCASGACFYTKNNIKFRLPNNLLLKLKDYEDLRLKIECKESNLIIAVERHLYQEMLSFQDKLCENLNNLENKKRNYVVSGDMNINTLDKSISQKKKLHYRININRVQIVDKQSNQV